MSSASRGRAVQSPQATSGRRFRRAVLGVLLVAGVLAGLRVGLHSMHEPVPSTAAESAGAIGASTATTPLEGAPGTTPDDARQIVEGSPAAEASVERHRLLVLPPSYQHVHPSFLETAKVTGDMIVSALRSKPDLEVVEVIRAQIRSAEAELSRIGDHARLGQKQRAEALARYFDAEFVIQLGPATQNWIFESEPAPSGASAGGFVLAVQYLAPEDTGTISTLLESPFDLGRTAPAIALEVYAKLLPDSAREEYFSILRDTLRPDGERLTALKRLMALQIPNAAVPVAIEFARASPPEIRGEAWAVLGGGVGLPIAQAMVDALLYDPEASVRRQVVEGLANYLGEPNVRSALEGVAVDDASAEVRRQAKWLLMTNEERRALLAESLHDLSLSATDRMAALKLAQSSRATANVEFNLDQQALAAVVEIARDSHEASAKLAAIRQVTVPAQSRLPPPFTDFLIECLGDADIAVRRAAVRALAPRRELHVQLALMSALAKETDAGLHDELDAILPQRMYRGRAGPR
jgi:HEAT repeats